jgi:hypothetical protein
MVDDLSPAGLLARFYNKPVPVFREFAIALCELLLEHEWPVAAQELITQVLADMRSEYGRDYYDQPPVASTAPFSSARYAYVAARMAGTAYAAAARSANACNNTRTIEGYRDAKRAAYLARSAAVVVVEALPSQRDRLHTIVMMLT